MWIKNAAEEYEHYDGKKGSDYSSRNFCEICKDCTCASRKRLRVLADLKQATKQRVEASSSRRKKR